jgi:hypothetical protein
MRTIQCNLKGLPLRKAEIDGSVRAGIIIACSIGCVP